MTPWILTLLVLGQPEGDAVRWPAAAGRRWAEIRCPLIPSDLPPDRQFATNVSR
jgi:hypothetical protein